MGESLAISLSWRKQHQYSIPAIYKISETETSHPERPGWIGDVNPTFHNFCDHHPMCLSGFDPMCDRRKLDVRCIEVKLNNSDVSDIKSGFSASLARAAMLTPAPVVSASMTESYRNNWRPSADIDRKDNPFGLARLVERNA